MPSINRACLTVGLALVVAGGWFVHAPARAYANAGQIEMFQDDSRLLLDPAGTLQQLRALGVGVIRVSLHWDSIAPSQQPSGFDPTDPASYPGWGSYDAIVQAARNDGIVIDFSLGGPAPHWATGRGLPASGGFGGVWRPSASAFKQFVLAAGTRYSGTYDPALNASVPGDPNALPRVSFWEIWNEPNFGGDLAPQATGRSTVPTAAAMYRTLLDAGWSGLQSTGHGRDTIVIGNLDARGQSGSPGPGAPEGYPGNFGATKPLQFVRALYCVGSTYKPLRGGAAAVVGCPTNRGASRRFRRAHPALFRATGFATHPYPVNLPPNRLSSNDPDYTEFGQLPRFARTLDRLEKLYGSGTHFRIYNNEYGYITNPPNHSLTPLNPTGQFLSPSTTAAYMNWAEYLSWRNPRIASTMQYLLYDPNPREAPEFGGFASGLIFYGGKRKPAYDAYRLPLFLPVTTARSRRQGLEVWGCLRPANYARFDTGRRQQVQIQYQRGSHGAFTTRRTVTINSSRGYFDLHIAFPASGSVRLAWTYPGDDALLSQGKVTPAEGDTVYSRTVRVTVK